MSRVIGFVSKAFKSAKNTLNFTSRQDKKKKVCSSLHSGAPWVNMHLELPRETKPPFRGLPDLLTGSVSSWLWEPAHSILHTSSLHKQLSLGHAVSPQPWELSPLGPKDWRKHRWPPILSLHLQSRGNSMVSLPLWAPISSSAKGDNAALTTLALWQQATTQK